MQSRKNQFRLNNNYKNNFNQNISSEEYFYYRDLATYWEVRKSLQQFSLQYFDHVITSTPIPKIKKISNYNRNQEIEAAQQISEILNQYKLNNC